MPSISTVAPCGTEPFFERLLEIKQALYSGGNFQFQFSLHTTDAALRDQHHPGQEVELRARWRSTASASTHPATARSRSTSPWQRHTRSTLQVLLRHFDPENFLVKITPLNPTYRATREPA